jgi:hypothetical protein
MPSELAQFMIKAEEIGPNTLEDHLTLQDLDQDYNERNAMKSAVTRALSNPNSPWYHLRGTVIFPSIGNRAGWGSGLEERADTLPHPRFETSLVMQSSVGGVVARNAFDSPTTEVALRGLMSVSATLSNRKQEKIGAGVMAIAGERDFTAHENKALRAALAKAEARVDELTAIVRQQLALMKPAG